MFSLNEGYRFVVCLSGVDLRKGLDGLCGLIGYLLLSLLRSRGYLSVRWSLEQEKSYTMSTKYKFHNPDGLYFVSFAVKDWIDAFTRNEYKNILIESLDFCQKQKGLEVFAWCVMSNHVHLIIRAQEGFLLQNILRDFKRHTSKKVVEAIKENLSVRTV